MPWSQAPKFTLMLWLPKTSSPIRVRMVAHHLIDRTDTESVRALVRIWPQVSAMPPDLMLLSNLESTMVWPLEVIERTCSQIATTNLRVLPRKRPMAKSWLHWTMLPHITLLRLTLTDSGWTNCQNLRLTHGWKLMLNTPFHLAAKVVVPHQPNGEWSGPAPCTPKLLPKPSLYQVEAPRILWWLRAKILVTQKPTQLVVYKTPQPVLPSALTPAVSRAPSPPSTRPPLSTQAQLRVWKISTKSRRIFTPACPRLTKIPQPNGPNPAKV